MRKCVWQLRVIQKLRWKEGVATVTTLIEFQMHYSFIYKTGVMWANILNLKFPSTVLLYFKSLGLDIIVRDGYVKNVVVWYQMLR